MYICLFSLPIYIYIFILKQFVYICVNRFVRGVIIPSFLFCVNDFISFYIFSGRCAEKLRGFIA